MSMKIVTIGEIVVEIMATEVDQALSETGTFTGPYPSGAPAIFIDQVAKLGVECAIISAVGNDGFGRINLDRLKQDGVDVSGISVLDQETTGSAFVTYHADGSRDFIFNIKNAACGKLNLDNANLTVLEQCTHLHIMGSSLFNKDIASLTTKAIEIVKGNQGSVSFDPNIRKELLDASMKRSLIEILKVTDIFMPSEAEITSLSESNNLENAINEYFNVYGVSEIVLKQGEKGAKVFTRTHTFEQKAFPVEEVDPTGAGDCFGGAYVAFRLQSKPIEESLRLATECGSRSVTVSGPMEGTSRLDELSGK
ncbi:putative carbohydrate kinase [Vibrio nigripulchritudo SFn27]|uniref:Putative carbohydrate kinase n=2 Tax=Vibrio nigripulchritudo TaxID=28173 RepID=U4KIJ2_9VIBR|nr:putative carbohydrate kinase [Vibrio nigripulchritudo BLFn1]CCN87849.1 putative carbohydrate kinase [Vibrio nigripulchritudo SFn27]CCN93722.1 putative carbohydrate kinase [Vibrio nigripulchritudo ENn2]CCO43093.1 putative carbohydrate kinase [Vibrio nigripulchritudo SFn135]CCO52532.1 putative carbohydrate kinase [Vibrio nigripulchritudo Wn13]CCO60775.1 putative carbohydrate kinase [Vibrio nigripulchritudo]